MGSAPCSAVDLWSQGLHFSTSSKATDDLAPLCHALRALSCRCVMPPSLALLLSSSAGDLLGSAVHAFLLH